MTESEKQYWEERIEEEGITITFVPARIKWGEPLGERGLVEIRLPDGRSWKSITFSRSLNDFISMDYLVPFHLRKKNL